MSSQINPNLTKLQGIVASEVIDAMYRASEMLRRNDIPHILIGGLAVGAYGHVRATSDVDFLVTDSAFVGRSGGIVLLRVPIVSINKVRIDVLAFEQTDEDTPAFEREVLDQYDQSECLQVASMPTLVHLKLKANRQKDIADLIELLKAGSVDIESVDQYLSESAPRLVSRWKCIVKQARAEE